MSRISERLIKQKRARQDWHTAMPGASTSNRRTVSIGVICHPRGAVSTSGERRAGPGASVTIPPGLASGATDSARRSSGVAVQGESH